MKMSGQKTSSRRNLMFHVRTIVGERRKIYEHVKTEKAAGYEEKIKVH